MECHHLCHNHILDNCVEVMHVLAGLLHCQAEDHDNVSLPSWGSAQLLTPICSSLACLNLFFEQIADSAIATGP